MRKIWKTTAIAFTSLTPLAALSCNLFNDGTSEFSFANYQDYMQLDLIDDLKRVYTYQEFGDLPELENFIKEERVAAAVGSDYFNASLAERNLIVKVDFARIFSFGNDKSKWESELQKIYTPETWKILNSFELIKRNGKGLPVDANGNVTSDANSYLHDIDGDGTRDYLWEYMIPYFSQNKVIAVNIKRLNRIIQGSSNPSNLIDEDISQPAFENLFPNKTYKGILNQLHTWGARDLAINDYFRDNVAIGSESQDGNTFGESLTETNYQSFINNFFDIVNPWTRTWRTSGVENLQLIIEHETGISGSNRKNTGNAEVGIMYNGDALFANAGGDGGALFSNQIRTITPKNPTFLLDGVIIPRYLNKNYVEWERIHTVLRGLFQGAETTYVINEAQNQFFENYTALSNNIYQNFDFVNYTPSYKHLHDYAERAYFVDENNNVDEVQKYILMSTRRSTNLISSNRVISTISLDLEQNVKRVYTQKLS